ncbi:hypothetical protein EBJ37_02560 [Escherichia coli]|nr:hypothetical protein [Escherichia coli]EFC4426953.1 hypothetical protein [Escherichia coli]EFN7650778.1 hypothetical protein [Escherichia coli]EFN8505383.1 hypothetical protein [Escherichia coli]EFN9189518.1 hypothetical protein [Escherichia coli]
MLSPPRPPASWGGFNAVAIPLLSHASLGGRTARTCNSGTCKTMHILHAQIKTGISQKKHKKTGIHDAGSDQFL